MPHAGCEVREVPLDAIDQEDLANCFRLAGLDLRRVDELARSIEEDGLLQFPVIVPGANGRYRIVCGFRRLAAIRLLAQNGARWKTVRCTIRSDLDVDKALRVSLAENLQRRSIRPTEIGLVIERLVRERGCTHEAIGEIFGFTKKTVQRYRRLMKADEAVLGATYENQIKFSHAILLAPLPAHLQRKLLKQVIEANMTAKRLESLIKGNQKGERKRRSALIGRVGSSSCGAKVVGRNGSDWELRVPLGKETAIAGACAILETLLADLRAEERE